MFPTINKKETGVNLRRIMDMRGVKPKDIQEYLGFGCVQSVYRWLDGVSMPKFTVAGAISLRSRLRGLGTYDGEADFEGILKSKMQDEYEIEFLL
jgi:hypothetical protein